MKIKTTLKTCKSSGIEKQRTGGTRPEIFDQLSISFPQYICSKSRDSFLAVLYEGDPELEELYEFFRKHDVSVQGNKYQAKFEIWETRIREYEQEELSAFEFWEPLSFEYLCLAKDCFATSFEADGKSNLFRPSRKKIGAINPIAGTLAVDETVLPRFDSGLLNGMEWQKIEGEFGRSLFVLRSNLDRCWVLNDFVTLDKKVVSNETWKDGMFCLPADGTFGVSQLRVARETLSEGGDVFLTRQSFSLDSRRNPYPSLVVSSRFKKYLSKAKLPMNWLPVSVE